MDTLVWSVGPFLLVFLVLLTGGAYSARGARLAPRPHVTALVLLAAAGVAAGLLVLLVGR